jgi:hypothetical protein
MHSEISFSETQRFTQVWLWLLVLLVAAIGWWAFVEQIVLGREFGTHPAPDVLLWIIFILLGIGFPFFFRSLKLVTELRDDHLRLRFSPICTRRVLYTEIKSAQARTYRPIVEYGGWGIRWSLKNGMAYNVSGNMGVQLELTNGKRLLIGSQRADELERAIKSRMNRL